MIQSRAQARSVREPPRSVRDGYSWALAAQVAGAAALAVTALAVLSAAGIAGFGVAA